MADGLTELQEAVFGCSDLTPAKGNIQSKGGKSRNLPSAQPHTVLRHCPELSGTATLWGPHLLPLGAHVPVAPVGFWGGPIHLLLNPTSATQGGPHAKALLCRLSCTPVLYLLYLYLLLTISLGALSVILHPFCASFPLPFPTGCPDPDTSLG